MLKIVPDNWMDFDETGTFQKSYEAFKTGVGKLSAAGAIWCLTTDNENIMAFKCSECSAEINIDKQCIRGKNNDEYNGTIKIITGHTCNLWSKLRSTLKYLGHFTKYIKCTENIQLSTSIGFLVEDTPPVLYAFGHKLIPNTTKDIVLAQTYHCNSRKCRDHTVETVEKDGVLCKITSRSATGSTKFNRSIFSYDSQANDNLLFFSLYDTE